MSKIAKIEPAVTTRCCPCCGYEMTQRAIANLKYNMPCPHCKIKTINDYVPVYEMELEDD